MRTSDPGFPVVREDTSATSRSESTLGAWLLLDPSVVPPRWQSRIQLVALVPLLAEEAERFVGTGHVTAALEGSDEALAHGLVNGKTTKEMARTLGVSTRSVQRRVAEMTRRFGVRNRAQLVRALTRGGFGSDGFRRNGDSP